MFSILQNGPKKLRFTNVTTMKNESSVSIFSGKYMRHVKLRPESDVDATALIKLVDAAYTDMKKCLEAK